MESGETKAGLSAEWLKKLSPLLAVVCLALLVRIVYLDAISATPFFNYPLIDAEVYDDFAARLSSEGELPEGPFYQPPLYPMFLGLLYWIFGRNLFIARLIQVLIGTVNVALTYKVAERISGPKTALGAGLIMAFYGTMVFYEAELLAPVLIVFLNLISILAIFRFLERRTKLLALLCGVFIGLSAVAHPVILLFALAASVYGAVCLRRIDSAMKTAKRLALGACFFLGIAIPIFPCAIYNASQDDTVLISYNGGINFYLGTGSDYESKVAIRPGREWKKLFDAPDLPDEIKPSEQSRYFTKKALGIIAADPKGYLVCLAKKLWTFVNGNEVMRNQEMYPFRNYSKLFSALVWKHGIAVPFGLLFPFSFVGILFAFKERKHRLRFLVLAVACHAAVFSVFFVTARYRMNVIPFLAVLAATGVGSFFQAVKARARITLAVMAGAFIAAFAVSNWRVGPMPKIFTADTYYDLGYKYRKTQNPEARHMFEMALKSDPKHADAAIHMGAFLDDEGDYEGAIRMYDKVLQKYPQDIYALVNKGAALYKLGRIGEAKIAVGQALKLDPKNEFAAELARKLKDLDGGPQ